MKQLTRKRIGVANERKNLWAIGLRTTGELRALRMVSDDATMIGFRRFGNAGAVCNLTDTPWPDQIELELTIAEPTDSQSLATPIPSGCPGQAQSAVRDAWNRLRAVEQWLISQAPEGAVREDAEFFYRLEQHFNRWFLADACLLGSSGQGADAIVGAVDDTLAKLIHRLSLRQARKPIPRVGLAEDRRDLIHSRLDSVFRARFGEVPGATRAATAIRTFACFGSGALRMDSMGGLPRDELRLRATNGAPNGATVFAFAEYALFRIEASADGKIQLWRDVLPGCVLAAESYLLGYHPLNQSGEVQRRAFTGDIGGPAPLLRHLAARSRRELTRQYEQLASRRNEQFFGEHLASLLRSGLEPLPVQHLSQDHRQAEIGTAPLPRGVRQVVFPMLQTIEVGLQRWWDHSLT